MIWWEILSVIDRFECIYIESGPAPHTPTHTHIPHLSLFQRMCRQTYMGCNLRHAEDWLRTRQTLDRPDASVDSWADCEWWWWVLRLLGSWSWHWSWDTSNDHLKSVFLFSIYLYLYIYVFSYFQSVLDLVTLSLHLIQRQDQQFSRLSEGSGNVVITRNRRREVIECKVGPRANVQQ